MLRSWTALAAVLTFAVSTAQAQTYPDRPVHVYVGYAAGSGPDIQARTVSQAVGTALGQSFIVVRAAAHGTPVERVLNA